MLVINIKSIHDARSEKNQVVKDFRGLSFLRVLLRVYDMIRMIFIYCNCVSTRWQWLVDQYKSRKNAA